MRVKMEKEGLGVLVWHVRLPFCNPHSYESATAGTDGRQECIHNDMKARRKFAEEAGEDYVDFHNAAELDQEALGVKEHPIERRYRLAKE